MIEVIEIILALMGFSATKNDCITNKTVKIEKGFFDDS